MELTRYSGILLHPTSFPGPHGIGDLGENAYKFVDFLAEAKQSLWQVLPLGPTGYGDSPYASFSSFAGNPLLINLDALVKSGDLPSGDLPSGDLPSGDLPSGDLPSGDLPSGDLPSGDLPSGDLPATAQVPDFPTDTVDYGWVIHWKMPLLEQAAHNFLADADSQRKAVFETFCTEQGYWLDEYALFMAVKEHFDAKAKAADIFGAMWSNYWDKDIALRQPAALDKWRQTQAETILLKKVLQFFFFQQWTALRQYANAQGIQIIGDIPIFVAPDSVDVWANPELFLLDAQGQPTHVAGVPPDYFSETGQLWGNPLYNWDAMAGQGFSWWIKRIQATLQLVDIIRIDHFRGFEAYWKIAAGEETAINGKWTKAPGLALFQAIEQAMGHLPILAEDLGVITPEVEALRDTFGFPGMKVLQFAFDAKEAGELNATNTFLPHNYGRNGVVYTGTHDNDTTLGWYHARTPEEQDLIRRYLARPDEDIVWDFIRMAMASAARFAIVPMQDILNLDSDARMNTPSTLGGNWAWRYESETLNPWISTRLAELVELYGRNPAIWADDQTQPEDTPEIS